MGPLANISFCMLSTPVTLPYWLTFHSAYLSIGQQSVSVVLLLWQFMHCWMGEQIGRAHV